MVERVTLLYNGGSVTVAKYSRIKVYHQSLGSIKGFIVGFDDEKITLIVPDDFYLFNNGIIAGKKTSFRNEELKGFAFYPEVKILESKKKSGGWPALRFIRVPDSDFTFHYSFDISDLHKIARKNERSNVCGKRRRRDVRYE